MFQCEMFGRAFDGSETHCEVILVIVPGYEETWSRVFVSDFDISARKRVEQELRKGKKAAEEAHRLSKVSENLRIAKEAAEESSRAKNRFLSNMSHELRTPLSAIIGFNDMLLREYYGNINHKQADYLTQIGNSGRHLLSLINDLLDLTKIDAGKTTLSPEFISAHSLIDEMVALLNIQFNNKKLNVKTYLDPSVEVIWGDHRKCRQILLNLLSNAIKFTPQEGSISVRMQKEDDSAIRISISDTGVGVPQDQIELIFSEFHQADRVRDEELGGAGIGLALTKRLVELHGGRIGVESTSEIGTTFWFTLPSQKTEVADDHKPNQEINANYKDFPTGRRILLIEDDELLRALTQEMLNMHNHDVAVARIGPKALEVAHKHRPELILMNIRAHDMGGLELTQKMRKLPQLADIPIIALTSETETEAIEKQQEAGCTGHLAKPFQSDELFEVLALTLGKGSKVSSSI